MRRLNVILAIGALGSIGILAGTVLTQNKDSEIIEAPPPVPLRCAETQDSPFVAPLPTYLPYGMYPDFVCVTSDDTDVQEDVQIGYRNAANDAGFSLVLRLSDFRLGEGAEDIEIDGMPATKRLTTRPDGLTSMTVKWREDGVSLALTTVLGDSQLLTLDDILDIARSTVTQPISTLTTPSTDSGRDDE